MQEGMAMGLMQLDDTFIKPVKSTTCIKSFTFLGVYVKHNDLYSIQLLINQFDQFLLKIILTTVTCTVKVSSDL